MAADTVLALEQVSKKFRKGQIHDSLRDLLPALARSVTRRAAPEALTDHEFWALRDVTFEVKRGEAFGIIGNNGAGKSTILKILSGIMRPTQGRVVVHGRMSALIEVSAGFHPDLTGRENIFLNGTILGMSKAEIGRKFDAIVAFSGLEEFIDTPVKRYSSGMFARLGFSVAAHVDPQLLIVDEVLSVGDFQFQRKCLEKMDAILAGGATVVFVSHNLRAVADLCTRSLLLGHGRVLELGTTSTVIQRYLDGDGGRPSTSERDVAITQVTFRGPDGETLQFESGETAWVDIEVQAMVACDQLAVSLYIDAGDDYWVFHTSTARLGLDPVSLKPGETYTCTFELDLHLGPGTYHVGVYLYRYDVGREFDRRFPAKTVFISSSKDVGGVANLNPRVTVATPARGLVGG